MPWRGSHDDDRNPPRHQLELDVLPETYTICRMPHGAAAPWASGTLSSVSRSAREAEGTTVISDEATVPETVEADRGWHALRIGGVFGFGEVGVLGAVLNPLARAGVPVMVVCTFETDYVLVKASRFERVRQVLLDAGHRFVDPPAA